MTGPLAGGCLCGAVRYAVAAPVERLVACFCADCRKVSGAAGSINALVRASAFRITQGTTRTFTRTAESGNALERHFCGDCGTCLFNPMGGNPEYVILKAGTLDKQAGMRIIRNVWTRSRPSWAPMDPDAEALERG